MKNVFKKLTKDIYSERGLDENGEPPGKVNDNSKYIYDNVGKAHEVEYAKVNFNNNLTA
jgi:hypothetical protein